MKRIASGVSLLLVFFGILACDLLSPPAANSNVIATGVAGTLAAQAQPTARRHSHARSRFPHAEPALAADLVTPYTAALHRTNVRAACSAPTRSAAGSDNFFLAVL